MTSATGISFATGIVEEPASAGSGDVTGPASATDGHLAVFNGATGKIIKDGGAVPAPGGATNTVQYNAGSSTFGGAALSAGQPLIGVNAAAPAGGVALGVYGGGLVLLEQHTASNSATLDFTSGITATYDEYVLEVISFVNATNNVDLLLRFSTDGGSTFATTNYEYVTVNNSTSNAGIGSNASTSANGILLCPGVDNSQSFGANARVVFYDIRSSALNKSCNYQFTFPFQAVARRYAGTGGGFWNSTTAVNALRLLYSSDNITSGIARLYGIAKA